MQHRAVSLIRVDLRFPEHMPVTIMDPDPDSAVISRFFESLKAKIQAYQREKTTYQQACACNHPALFLVSRVWQGKRQETLSRDITAQQRYPVLAGDFTVPSSLATLIQLAWCSALHLEPRQGNGLVHFFQCGRLSVNRHHLMLALLPMIRLCRVDVLKPRKASDKKPGEAAVLWIKRGDVEAMQKAMERARYLVKYETKQHDGSGQRNYGCSRGAGRLLDGR